VLCLFSWCWVKIVKRLKDTEGVSGIVIGDGDEPLIVNYGDVVSAGN